MKSALFLALLSAVSAAPHAEPTVKQFEGPCKDLKTAKYYSIDKTVGNCGETCVPPSRYGTLKIFEPGLTKADNDYPCKTLGYSKYLNSPTHGFWILSVTIDMYAPDSRK